MSLESRLAALETKHAGPGRIWVTLGDSGVYTSNGETLTAAEFEARYSDDEDMRVIHVSYLDGPWGMGAPDA